MADNLGTLRDIADFNETTLATTVTNHRTFNANGKLVAETNAAVDLLFAFTGKQFDDSTGLQHNLFRWYDANLGQWLSEDPLGFIAGDENVRRYVGNRVTLGIDITGLQETSILPKPKDKFVEFPNLSIPTEIQTLTVTSGSAQDMIVTSIAEFVSRMATDNKSIHLIYKPDSFVSKQVWNSENNQLLAIMREWYEHGADSYHSTNPSSSSIKIVQYEAPKEDILGDMALLYFRQGDVHPEMLGSFTLQYETRIDPVANTVYFKGRVFNVWSIESMTRNPVTKEPGITGEFPKVYMTVEIEHMRQLGAIHAFAR